MIRGYWGGWMRLGVVFLGDSIFRGSMGGVDYGFCIYGRPFDGCHNSSPPKPLKSAV